MKLKYRWAPKTAIHYALFRKESRAPLGFVSQAEQDFTLRGKDGWTEQIIIQMQIFKVAIDGYLYIWTLSILQMHFRISMSENIFTLLVFDFSMSGVSILSQLSIFQLRGISAKFYNNVNTTSQILAYHSRLIKIKSFYDTLIFRKQYLRNVS